MRCKKHITDLSSNVGVCASCLRDSLFILVASTERDHYPLAITPSLFSRQKSVNNAVKSTSQVYPFKKHPRSSSNSRFSFLWKLFRFKPDTDHNVSGSEYNPTCLTRNVSAFGFCLSPLVRRPRFNRRAVQSFSGAPYSTNGSRRLSGFGKFNHQLSSG